MSSVPEIAVEFRGVSFSMNHRLLLSYLNLTIYQGEVLVLLGRSGSGKTTILKLINYLLNPTEGQVLVYGRPTTHWNVIELRRSIGYVVQEIGLFPHFSIRENVALVPSLQKWSKERIEARVCELLNLVGLLPEKFAQCYPHQLSGGQRQRVGVARALAADPPILLMDEPFGALDPITRLELQKQFHQLQKQLGKIIIFVTHDIQEAFFLGTRLGLVHEGHHAPEILLRTGEHLILVTIAMTIAIFIGIPLGILITRQPKLAGPILLIANAIQTIPSLAIFGFLISVPFIGGIGKTPAIVALTLYALPG